MSGRKECIWAVERPIKAHRCRFCSKYFNSADRGANCCGSPECRENRYQEQLERQRARRAKGMSELANVSSGITIDASRAERAGK
jgi:predicted  nucleic acid-binding Zn-ribbon protein